MATEVNYARRDYCFLGTTVEIGENSPESNGKHHQIYIRHSWSGLADQPEKSDLCNDNECGAFLDEHRRSRRDRFGFEEMAGDARELKSVEKVSNAFGLEVEGDVARVLELEGLEVRIGVLSQSPGELRRLSQQKPTVAYERPNPSIRKSEAVASWGRKAQKSRKRASRRQKCLLAAATFWLRLQQKWR